MQDKSRNVHLWFHQVCLCGRLPNWGCRGGSLGQGWHKGGSPLVCSVIIENQSWYVQNEHKVQEVLQAGQIAAVFNGLRQRDLPGVKSGAKGWSDYRIRWHPVTLTLTLTRVCSAAARRSTWTLGSRRRAWPTTGRPCPTSVATPSNPTLTLPSSGTPCESSPPRWTWCILTFGCAGMVWSCLLLHPGTWWRGRRFLSPTTTPSRRLRNGIRSAAGWILLIKMPPQISNHWHCPKNSLHNTKYTIPNNYTL